MPYSKQTWADNDTTKPVSANRMNHIEDGVETAQAAAEEAHATAEGAQIAADNADVSASNAVAVATAKPSVGLVLALGG